MIDKPVLLLSLAMFFAIGTERLLELLRSLFDHLEAKGMGPDNWPERAEALRRRIQIRLDNARVGDATTFNLVLAVVSRYLCPADARQGGLFAISVDQLRSTTIRVRYTLLAVALGLGLAVLFDLDLFRLVNQESSGAKAGTLPFSAPGWLGLVITGVVMGLGSGPVHGFIRALEKARRKRV